MKKKTLIICLVSSLLLVTIFNVLVYEMWKMKDDAPYFREGNYKGEFVGGTAIKYEASISLKSISKKDYRIAQGKNVFKDCALNSESDYYLIEGIMSIDDNAFELLFDGLTKKRQSSGGYIYYDKNNNYIMPGYYIENNMRILYLSINYNDYWIPANYVLVGE